MSRWIEFNGTNSDEILTDRILITNIVIGTPTPKSYIEEIPFSSEVIDYSFINGINFNNRAIEVSINIEGYNKESLMQFYSKVLSWLLRPNYSQLKVSEIEGYYIGKAETITSLEDIVRLGNLTIIFNCKPYKIVEEINKTIKIATGKTIYINGSFMPATPLIKSDKECIILFNGKKFNLYNGNNRNFDMKILEGMNKIELVSKDQVELYISYKRGEL